MEINDTKQKKKTVVIIVNNEVILSALKKVVEGLGYEVRQGIESCGSAGFGFVGAYFAFLGILKHLRAVNSSLPLVLITNSEDKLNETPESVKDFYDIITLDSYNETDIKQKITRWFSQGNGKFLLRPRLLEKPNKDRQ